MDRTSEIIKYNKKYDNKYDFPMIQFNSTLFSLPLLQSELSLGVLKSLLY